MRSAASDVVVVEPLLGEIDARRPSSPSRAQPGRRRRQPERLTSEFVGARSAARASTSHRSLYLRFRHEPAAARGIVRPQPRPHDRAFFGHPRGLSTLFFTEMWERFSYYGMRALLILFMTAPLAAGGLGFDTGDRRRRLRPVHVDGVHDEPARRLDRRPPDRPAPRRAVRRHPHRVRPLQHGVPVAADLLPRPGADRRRHRPAQRQRQRASSGSCTRPSDDRRDAGFSIFYMGINLGAFIAPLVCGYLGQRVNWHSGFAAAGVGMVLGLVQYVLGGELSGRRRAATRRLPHRRGRRRGCDAACDVWGGRRRSSLSSCSASAWRPACCRSPPTQIADAAGYLLLVITVVFFGWLFFAGDWTPAERKRLYAIGVFFLAAALFWSEFEQAGSTLNLFADRATRTSVFGWDFPSSWFQSLQPLFIITFAPVFAWLWVRLGRREPSSPAKFALGLLVRRRRASRVLVAAASAGRQRRQGRARSWLIVTYLLHTFGELSLSPVGLSSMTKLAPARVAGLMMGVWFLGHLGRQLHRRPPRVVLRVDAAAQPVRRRRALSASCAGLGRCSR